LFEEEGTIEEVGKIAVKWLKNKNILIKNHRR